jgi:hypothetical protein
VTASTFAVTRVERNAMTAGLPPTHSTSLAMTAIPASSLAAAAEAAFVLPGSGMVMSIACTAPYESSGDSKAFDLPTTSIAVCSGFMYCFATRATSAAVTFSTSARYLSQKSARYP